MNNVIVRSIRSCDDLRKNYPRDCNSCDERIGGFWLPFLTGAIISAPAWYILGNKQNQEYYPQYYQPYYPYR